MNVAATQAGLHPLLEQLFSKHGFVAVDASTFDDFVHGTGSAAVLFMEDPLRVRETLDLAVIGPELTRAFAGRFRVAVALFEASRVLQPRFGFRRYPSLIMFRDGAYIGTIDGLRNWQEYIDEMSRLLESPPTRPPAIGIAVQGASVGSAGCAH